MTNSHSDLPDAAAPAVGDGEPFTEERSAEVVSAGFAGTPDPRLRQVMTSLARHLHDFVEDVEPTEEEWAPAIAFLTATGQKCDDVRQEFVLLSDVLGCRCSSRPSTTCSSRTVPTSTRTRCSGSRTAWSARSRPWTTRPAPGGSGCRTRSAACTSTCGCWVRRLRVGRGGAGAGRLRWLHRRGARCLQPFVGRRGVLGRQDHCCELAGDDRIGPMVVAGGCLARETEPVPSSARSMWIGVRSLGVRNASSKPRAG
jgi:hypothetical protein